MTTPAAPPDDAVAELEQRHRELCEFVSLVSHDLRTPLTAIRGYAQLLQRQTRDEAFAPLRANLTMIMQQADRLASYTELLLDVARLRTGRLALQLGAVDLAQVARAAAASLHPPAQVASEPTGGLVVDADAKRTHQIVQAMVTFAAERRGVGGMAGDGTTAPTVVRS